MMHEILKFTRVLGPFIIRVERFERLILIFDVAL